MGTRRRFPCRKRAKAHIGKRQHQSEHSSQNSPFVATHSPPRYGTKHQGQQWDAVGQIGCVTDTAGVSRETDFISDLRSDPIIDAISLGAAAEHLRQLLATATPFFVTAATTAVLDLDDGLPTIQRPNDRRDGARLPMLAHQRRSGAISSSGRNLAATASRARKMRERTVPIGQSMMLAISS